MLAALSLVLLVMFVAAMVIAAAPPKLLDHSWQLGVIAALINNAFLALMGVLLLVLALGFDPTRPMLRDRWKAWRPWIVAASLGFLLLIPLQGFAAWGIHTSVTLVRQKQTSQTSEKLTELRAAITSANTHEELQAKVKNLFGPNAGLSPAELRTPIGVLRNILLARAEQASNQLAQQIEAQAGSRPDQLVKETLRISISAAAYAIGFGYFGGVLPRNRRKGTAARSSSRKLRKPSSDAGKSATTTT
jgi:hypothetical protein